jgi:hypothetical protein
VIDIFVSTVPRAAFNISNYVPDTYTTTFSRDYLQSSITCPFLAKKPLEPSLTMEVLGILFALALLLLSPILRIFFVFLLALFALSMLILFMIPIFLFSVIFLFFIASTLKDVFRTFAALALPGRWI